MTPLQDLCQLITDGKHGDCQDETGSGYYFISCKDVKHGWIDYSCARQITEAEYFDTHRRTQLSANDIIITNSGTIGRMAFVPNAPETARTTFQKSVAIIKPNQEKVFPKWLYYSLMANIEGLIACAGGTAQKNLLLRDMRAFAVEAPPIKSQRRIASILSAYDDLIENNTPRIQILEEIAKRIYKEWFVDFRFPGHDKVTFVDSELGRIPSGWEVRRLSDVASVNSQTISGNKGPEHIQYIDIQSVSPGRVNEIKDLAFSEAPSRARRKVQSKDILWSTVRPNRKSYALLLDPDPNTIASTGFAVITPHRLPYTHLYCFLSADSFVEYLTNHATGSAYPAVNQNDFKNAKIVVPDQPTIEAFHDLTDPMYYQIHYLMRKNSNLRQTRDLLLPKLISGEIDVSEMPDPKEAAAA